MRSQLNRHVLRRLRAHPDGLRLPHTTTRPSICRYAPGQRVVRPSQRRTFLGFFQKAPRILKEPEVEPGFESLLKYGAYIKENLRPPPREELVTAFRQLYRHKIKNSRPVNALEARISHHVLNHLSDSAGNPSGFNLNLADLRTAQVALAKKPRDDPTDLVEFSKALFLQIEKLSAEEIPEPKVRPGWHETDARSKKRSMAQDNSALLRILSRYGRAIEARDHLLNYWPIPLNTKLSGSAIRGLWIPVLQGLAKEGREKELLEFLTVMTRLSRLPYSSGIHETMATFYARRNDMENMKLWFERPIEADSQEAEVDIADYPPLTPVPSLKTYSEVLLCAIRNNENSWALNLYQRIAEDVVNSSEQHSESAVLIVYRFAVLLLGKGSDYIEQMIMSNPNPNFRPTISIINALIEAAMEKEDVYLAERMAALVSKLGLDPDRQLYSLQIEYRTQAGDLDGAVAAYQSLRNFETEEEDWLKLNRLIRALCTLEVPNYDKVLDITSYLEQLSATLEAETVVSLCMAFLKNDEQYEVIDTLSLHTVHFSSEERALVSKAFVGFCLDKANSTARVWDAYALLRQFFPDMARGDRVKIMDAFFDRKRADMACHVFGHMRQHSNEIYRPTTNIYVRCLEGLGRAPDLESLRMVHNMLKMDTTIQLNTKVYNALMIAYTACGDEYKALDFWKDIDTSVEGPNYQSLEIILRTYEMTPSGDEPAKALWDRLHRMEIDMSANLVAAYAGVMAAHSHLNEAKRLLGDMEAEVGQRPNVLTLGIVYNALQNDDFQADFEAWAKEEFPHVWNQLEKKRRRRDAEGLMQFQITRPWKA